MISKKQKKSSRNRMKNRNMKKKKSDSPTFLDMETPQGKIRVARNRMARRINMAHKPSRVGPSPTQLRKMKRKKYQKRIAQKASRQVNQGRP